MKNNYRIVSYRIACGAKAQPRKTGNECERDGEGVKKEWHKKIVATS